MRTLEYVKPTDEQLKIVSRNRPVVELIRGAAGSGKTTTALLRLKSLVRVFLSRKEREQSTEPVRILVLTYNRTLRGYIDVLARNSVSETHNVEIRITTFAKWAMRQLGNPRIICKESRKSLLLSLSSEISLPDKFILDEIEYVMGRFLPSDLDDYLTATRYGRGSSPRVDKNLRQFLLEKVIRPYQQHIDKNNQWDWNDLAVKMADIDLDNKYDVVIVDETQDFSANQLRAINRQLAPTHAVTFVVDTAQRIYARGFTWQEAGFIIRPENSKRLEINYRNTIEIARFAAPLVNGIPIDDDATIPDFSKCIKHGEKPIVISGRFAFQTQFVIDHIQRRVDLSKESVAMLHPFGWFRYIKQQFDRAGLSYVEITQRSEWPTGSENIAFSTLHSSKGLEFDHVFIIGLDAQVTPHGSDDEDDSLITLRRLLAMGISRARISVVLGSKPGSESSLFRLLDSDTYVAVTL